MNQILINIIRERDSIRKLLPLLTILFTFLLNATSASANGYYRKKLIGYVLRYNGELVFTEQPDSTFTVYSLDLRDPKDKKQTFCEYREYAKCAKRTISFSSVIKIRAHFQLTDVTLDQPSIR